MKCQVCGGNNSRVYKTISGVAIYQCLSCLCGFVDRLTPRKKTNEIYRFEEYSKREKQFRKRYSKTLQLVKTYSPGKHILEVGGGFGLLSKMMSEAGYEVDMLEPDVNPTYTKGTKIKVIKSRFEEFSFNAKSTYDAIILYDVIEHVDDSKLVVKQLKKLLKEDGIVIIQTPNYLSLMARLVRNWSWWMVEDHRYYFSKKSLRILFSDDMWNEELYQTHEEWEDFKKNLDGNFSNKIPKYAFFSLFVPLYFAFRQVLWYFGYGGLHLGIWRKR